MPLRRPALRFAALALTLALCAPSTAEAFCGFYVGSAGGELYANATMVVLMRSGTRTVLSMQNAYEGPPENFALVVPVPAVLHEEDVHTLPREIFTRVDSLAAPRLVEYWEGDPCNPRPPPAPLRRRRASGAVESESDDVGVTVEASFSVGEYDIVILGAEDSNGLETWLHREHYAIPAGAAEVLRPYVEGGTKFFVARVNVERVTFAEGRALLSPLRVQYDSPELSLPVRLGLLSSDGEQDLIVHVLADARYEVANYENAFIPTNLRVTDGVRHELGAFYEHLFRETVEGHPRTVVTEYAWSASTCDPCPTEPLSPGELATLGLDAMEDASPSGWVLTRLHYRYRRETLGDDLVFRAAPGVVGGTGIPNPDGSMTTGTTPSERGSTFQGRYVILHPWEGPLECAAPRPGGWGGPLGETAPRPLAATNTALTRGITEPTATASSYLVSAVPELGLTGAAPSPPAPTPPAPLAPVTPTPAAATSGSCAGCAALPGGSYVPALMLTTLVLLIARRRR